jgi:hypothetical protein
MPRVRATTSSAHLLSAGEWGPERRLFVGRHLAAEVRGHGPFGLLISEDALASRTDGWLADRPDLPLVFCGDDVYNFATAERPVEEIGSLAYRAFWEPSVAVVGRLPAGAASVRSRSTLSPATLEHLAATATVVGIGAWDQEATLLWTPASAPRGR